MRPPPQTPIFLPAASPLAALGSSCSQVQGEACIDVMLITEEEKTERVDEVILLE